MSKDNIKTKFRDAMGLSATYDSPKMRQGVNNPWEASDPSDPWEKAYKED